jgi:maleylacetate reductase
LIDTALPQVLADGQDLEARTRLLEGARHAGAALGSAGLALGHAMAQALGGRYGASHGALNALCLAPALRFNAPVVPDAIAALARAMRAIDAPARVEELARLGGFERLRELGIPEDELAGAAAETAERPAARSNPRPATPTDIEALLRSIW